VKRVVLGVDGSARPSGTTHFNDLAVERRLIVIDAATLIETDDVNLSGGPEGPPLRTTEVVMGTTEGPPLRTTEVVMAVGGV